MKKEIEEKCSKWVGEEVWVETNLLVISGELFKKEKRTIELKDVQVKEFHDKAPVKARWSIISINSINSICKI